MYTIQNHRINFDQITHIDLGEAMRLNGPGTDIILDSADTEIPDMLDQLKSQGWLPVNGKLVNPRFIVSMSRTQEDHLKVNVAGLEIWVPDEEEKAALAAITRLPKAA